jgi:formylmethanofuran dehydrogenase subunit E
MLTVTELQLSTPIDAIASRPGVRVHRDECGAKIMNESEIHHDGLTLCRACAGNSDYHMSVSFHIFEETTP